MRRLLGSWRALSALAAAVVALLFAAGLPLVVAALRSPSARIACIALIAAGWALAAWLRGRRAAGASTAIAAALVESGAVGGDETRMVAGRMAEAMAALEGAAGRRRDYLYARPWYVIIGPPGAGKTTALLRSGLRFPAGDQALKGLGGTRDLDFWFADQAVLVDTAGRYTTQDSDAAADAAGWTGFLGLLKRHRPLAPVNGVIVAIGLDDLIDGDGAAIDRHARAVRARLAELTATLGTAPPVYVLFTKADLLAGFAEYFDDLDAEGRRAVLGATLSRRLAAEPAADLAESFDAMARAIADRQPRRLAAEGDRQRRSLLLGFPAQLRAVRASLLRFLDGALGDAMLRGFYLTSGVQQGTPLDRLLAGTAEVYDRPQHAAAGGEGRAYFLNRLLTEVVFAEAGLAGGGAQAGAARRRRMIGGLAAVGIAAALALVAWGVSFAANRSFQRRLAGAAVAARDQVRRADLDLREVRVTDPDLRAALPALDAARDLPRGYGAQAAAGPPLTMTFGLYQAGLGADAAASYRALLRRVMLPRLLLRLEQVMGSDPRRARRALAVYLMLGGQRPFDPAAVAAFVTADWASDVYPGPRDAAVRRSLAAHLDALLHDPDRDSVWPARRAPLDGPLIAQVSSGVSARPPSSPAAAAVPAAAAGPLGPAYAQEVLPACRSVAQGRYPFFGAATDDASPAEMQRVFGAGGTMEGFVLRRAMPAMDTGGPIWRWRNDDPATATLDPQSPEEFGKAIQIRDLLVGGLPLKVSATSMGADVTSVDITASGMTDSFTRAGGEVRPLTWSATGAPGAEIRVRGANGAELARYKAGGPWALFRLIDQATRENAGPKAFDATFGDGARAAVLRIELPSERNPFSRGGVWSFRCPVAL